MKRIFKPLGLAITAAFFSGALGAGCSETVGDIDRTQPDKLHKSLFAPQHVWYYKQTVVHVPSTSGGYTEGSGSRLLDWRSGCWSPSGSRASSRRCCSASHHSTW